MSIIKKYGEPTPKYWRQIGDFALVLIPALHVAIGNAPNFNEDMKYWLMIACDVALLALKFWTNTKSIHSK